MVTLDFGPRIIFLGKDSKQNILFEDIDDVFCMNNKNHQRIFGKNNSWHIYGGHRFWMSPETILTYAPDNDKVKLKIINENTFEFIAPIQKITNIQFVLLIKIKNNEIIINHQIINHDNKPKLIAPWAITALTANGIAKFKLNNEDNGFLPNRNLILWSYTDIKDQRLTISNHEVNLKMNPNIKRAFKIGTNNKNNKVSYQYKNLCLDIESKYIKDVNYPDNGCSLEVYTNQHFLEIETLGPLTNLKPKQKIIHLEKWILNNKQN